jgi:hypothetical protein
METATNPIPKEKLPKLLADLASEIDKGFLEEEFEVAGHKYKIRLLTDGEVNWKNRFIDGLSSALSMMSQRKSATLAIAIREIDGNAVVDIFRPEEGTKEFDIWKDMTAIERKFAAAKSLYDFLSNRTGDFTGELFTKFAALEERRGEVIQNLKKS